MGHGLFGSIGLIAGLSAGRLEEVALGTAAGLVLMLLAVRAWFSHDRRMRRAASGGYHQRDVAHYTPGGLGRPVEAVVADPKSRPLAPSFTAPAHGRRPHGDPGEPRPDASPGTPRGSSRSLGTFDPVTNFVRAFDTEEALRQRPPTPLPSTMAKMSGPGTATESAQDVPDLPVDEDLEEIPPPAGALPLLEQPPPGPPPGNGERHSSAG